MLKKVFSVVITLALVLSALPCNVKAAEGEGTVQPTRVQSEPLKFTDEAAENKAEGWKWTPDPAGGGTLELENCYIQSETTGILDFDMEKGEKTDINIVLRGMNILETKSQIYNPMVGAIIGGESNVNWIISEDGEGSLETRTTETITSNMSPYVFGGNSLTIKSGTITSSVAFCMVYKGIYVEDGCFSLETPESAKVSGGLYTINGPVGISGGKIDINSYVGIFIAGNTNEGMEAGGHIVNISGGEVNIKAGFTGIHINKNNNDADGAQSVNISGGKVNCEAGAAGVYCKDFNVYSDGVQIPQVNVSVSPDSTVPAILPSSGKVNISGGIVTAVGGVQLQQLMALTARIQ